MTSKPNIHINVLDVYEINTLSYTLEYDLFTVSIKHVNDKSTIPCDFVIYISNRNNVKLPSTIKVYELACFPASFQHFKNYIYLFAKLYLLELQHGKNK